MIAVAAGPAVAIVPVATPALTPVPGLHGQTPAPIAHMPIPPDTFNGAMSIHTTQLPILPDAFNGALSMHMIQPTIKPDTFINAQLSGQLPSPAQFIGITAMAAEIPILSPAAFANITPSAVMPTPINFENIDVASVLPKITAPNVFNNAEISAQLPTRTDFDPAIADGSMTSIQSASAFNGAIVAHNIPLTSPVLFKGTEAVGMLPQQPVFEGIKTAGIVTQAVRADNFTGVFSIGSIEQPVKPSDFYGVKTRVAMLEGIDFKGTSAYFYLKVKEDPMIFENLTVEKEVKIMFPDGSKIAPTYALGIPLGAEKPLMEPRIKEENKR